MTRFVRLFPIVLIALLTAGPLLAAPLAVHPSTTLSAPAPAPSSARSLLTLLGYGVSVFGAIAVKDAGSLAIKYAGRARAAAGDYKSGVEGAGAAWEQGAGNAEQAYKDGVNDAMTRSAFSKGVRASGAAHYVKRASELGGARYAQGIDAGKDRWAQNTAPVLQVIAGLNLPPKGARRSPQNMERANMVATALGKWKTGR